MKNLAKLKLQTEQQKGKTKPMLRARIARAVPQVRKLARQMTGRKDGGTMTKNPKAKDRLAEGSEARHKKILKRGLKGAKEVLTMTEGKRSGGVIRPKPTYKGKVLKPKPIKSKGIGMAIRGFGKAFKKGN